MKCNIEQLGQAQFEAPPQAPQVACRQEQHQKRYAASLGISALACTTQTSLIVIFYCLCCRYVLTDY
jgi:hypothetical protein